MTLLLNCQSLSKSFGSRILFQDLSLSIFAGDRIGLIGPNGTGKSTLLRILSKIESPNSGTLAPKRGLKIGYVPQMCEFPDQTPSDVLLESLAEQEEMPDYDKELLVQTWLSKLGFTGAERSALKLSGGWKKRLSIAQELVKGPDLLFLDEPTNHLDLEGVLWLEKFLAKECPTYLLVSHDRYFLHNMCNRIIEINPQFPKGMFALDGNYGFYLSKKEEFLEGQIQQERSIASKARRELDWLRQSPKARTTKSQSRVDEAHEILDELSQFKMRNRQRTAHIDFTASERETRKLIVAKNLSKTLSDKPLFRHLDFTLSPGTRMGLMGPNGSGKTTLLRLISGELTPDIGTLKTAEDLQIVHFDQHRRKLPDTITLKEALSPNGDFVKFRGQMIHVNGWCKRFLFSPSILDMPLEKLSGGERARIAIAHLMLQPADVLLLDEPTNDLDIPTLETLEESLLEFPGAVVLITHDRCMLDRTCNLFLALGVGETPALYAEYAQWEAASKANAAAQKSKEKKQSEPSSIKPVQKGKLSYAEKKELEQIESKIAESEAEVQSLNEQLQDPAIALDMGKLEGLCQQVALVETRIEQLYLRWEELEKKLFNA